MGRMVKIATAAGLAGLVLEFGVFYLWLIGVLPQFEDRLNHF